MIDDVVVHLYYYPNSQQKMGVVFNVVGQVKGLVKESQYVLIDNLSEKEKACFSFSLKFFLFSLRSGNY